MPGAYAHMTLVNSLREPGRAAAAGIPAEASFAVGTFLSYCELGAVSPDYPYLDLGNADQNRWADRMHYVRTGDMIRAGVRRVRSLTGDARLKPLAWLLGYAAHVATDVTIHPVIERKVGTYAEHKKEHRLCELNQDVYVYRRFGAGHLIEASHFSSGIGTCCAPDDSGKLDPEIAQLWRAMLFEVHPDDATKSPPDIDRWHAGFRFCIGKIAAGGRHLVPFARHIVDGEALTYPEEPDDQFLKYLVIPGGGTLHYDEIFERAIANVGRVWADVSAAVLGPEGRELVASVRDWNLDTGRDGAGTIGFWEVA